MARQEKFKPTCENISDLFLNSGYANPKNTDDYFDSLKWILEQMIKIQD